MFSLERLKRLINHLWVIAATILRDALKFMKTEKLEDVPNEEYKSTSEISTQTGQEDEDTVDFFVDALKEAVEKVSAAIYQVCFSIWHRPPEVIQNQPLYKEISAGIQDTYSNMKRKARPMEEYEIIICIATSLIAHLKNFRENKRTHKYNTRQDEVNFLRKHTECLLKYWLPESLKSSSFTLVFLIEILSINVLEPTISNLADFTFINQVIVRTLDSEESSEQNEDFDTGSGMTEDAGSEALVASNTCMESDNIKSRKKEKKGFLHQIKGFKMPRLKLRKQKPTDESGFRSYTEGLAEDTTDIVDDVTVMDFHDSDDDSVDTDDLKTAIRDTLLQKWITENWTAIVFKNRAEKEHEYEICVSKEDDGDNTVWLIKRSEEDFSLIYDIICKKHEDSNVFKTSKTAEEPARIGSHFFQTINTTPEKFIETLVDLIRTQQEPAAAFFLSPFKFHEEERELLDEDFPGNNEELTVKSDTEDKSSAEDIDTRSHSEGSNESDGYRRFKIRKTKKRYNKLKNTSDNKLEDNVAEINEAFISENAESRTEFPRTQPEKGLDVVGFNIKEMQNHVHRKTIKKQRNKLQDTFLEVIYHLADELFAGGTYTVRGLHKIGFLNKKSTEILEYMPNIYAERQIEWYLSQISELLLSETPPLLLSPDELQAKALELLDGKLKSSLSNTCVKFLFGKSLLKNLKASHESFQDSKANKATLFRLLEDLTKIITDGST
ncbi:uncharacterized protein LOC142100617 [Mixophyes fleayi]|uniref:uncharacterized protein LOC142100617 n=1 Tax=Mixophyes fleayi TaxID=3061075 RepID=UPI003F4E0700